MYTRVKRRQSSPARVFYPLGHGAEFIARVAELVDALDLGSSGVTREGSSPSFRTIPPLAWEGLVCPAVFERPAVSPTRFAQ